MSHSSSDAPSPTSSRSSADPARVAFRLTYEGTAEMLQKHLDRYPASLNELAENDRTLLHMATYHHDPVEASAISTLLLKRGIDPLSKDDTGLNPLEYAAFNGQWIMLEDLWKALSPVGASAAADRDASGTFLPQALFSAVSQNDLHALFSIPSSTPIPAEILNHATFLALDDNHLEALLWLLKRGADPNQSMRLDDSERTPLQHALHRNNSSITRLLVHYGATLLHDLTPIPADNTDALFAFSKEAFLRSPHDCPPQALDILLRHHPRFARDPLDSEGNTVFHFLLDPTSPQWRKMCEAGGDPNTPNRKGELPLALQLGALAETTQLLPELVSLITQYLPPTLRSFPSCTDDEKGQAAQDEASSPGSSRIERASSLSVDADADRGDTPSPFTFAAAAVGEPAAGDTHATAPEPPRSWARTVCVTNCCRIL